MKKKIKLILLFAMTTMVWSCNELPKKDSNARKKVAKIEKTERKNAEDKMLERLRNTSPVKVADLEAWFPKTLEGLSLERTKSMPGYNLAQLTGWYQRAGEKMIILYITDAAGPDGDIIANKINVLGTEPESDVGDIQMRSVTVKGRAARQDYKTKDNFTNILFFHNQRFMIKIMAYDHNVEETWRLVDELDFNTLDNLIQ